MGTIGFTMESDLGKVPYQQYKTKIEWGSAKGFDVRRTDQMVGIVDKDGNGDFEAHVEEWILTNSQNMNHPFHIHVNPFQVKEVKSDMVFMMTIPHGPDSETCGFTKDATRSPLPPHGICEQTIQSK